MNAKDFLNMILDKHHGGHLPEEEGERDPLWEKDRIEPLSNGCEWIDDVDKQQKYNDKNKARGH